MPSTVLGQNDSGVGVKNGVNAFSAKNFLGTFAPPFAVINDYDLLRTLPARDVRAGLAEAVKVSLIRDRELFSWLEQNADALRACEPAAVEQSVRVAAEIHLRHIATAGDPFELGSARPLDFGHWSAHKLESLTGHAVRHGEAVAIGMALDCRYAVLAGLLAEADQLRVQHLLERRGFRLYDDALGRLDASTSQARSAGSSSVIARARSRIDAALRISADAPRTAEASARRAHLLQQRPPRRKPAAGAREPARTG
jgi:3-dehydroquinate synthase